MEISSAKRLTQLDFLRAIAIFLVIGNHSAICPPETSYFLNRITGVWYRGGWAGVDLFFVLSGFLIAGLLFSEYKKSGTIDLKRFLIRRGFKIYPAFWFLILMTLIVTVFSGEMIYRGGFVRELLFIQNYKPGIWDHTWSLAVEEHFYIFLSLLFFGLISVRKNSVTNAFDAIPKIFILLASVCLFWRCLDYKVAGFVYEINIEQTHFRLDSLFYGVFLAYLWNFRGLAESEILRKYKSFIGVIGVCCFIPVFIFDLGKTDWLATYGLTMLYFGGGCILLALLKPISAKVKFSKKSPVRQILLLDLSLEFTDAFLADKIYLSRRRKLVSIRFHLLEYDPDFGNRNGETGRISGFASAR